MTTDLRHLHDRDFARWAHGQARALRDGRFRDIDREILANELERLVSRERAEVNQRLEALTVQLLLWTVQPAARTMDLQAAIVEQRSSVDRVLEFSPSLRPVVESALGRTYAAALETVAQAGIPSNVFPARARLLARSAARPRVLAGEYLRRTRIHLLISGPASRKPLPAMSARAAAPPSGTPAAAPKEKGAASPLQAAFQLTCPSYPAP